MTSDYFTDHHGAERQTYAVAGMETSARTLAWGMKRLSRSPHVQQKLRKELMDAGLHGSSESKDFVRGSLEVYVHLDQNIILQEGFPTHMEPGHVLL
jgi:cytochrome P450